MTESCGLCKFYIPAVGNAEVGNCHRYAPRPGEGGVWPQVDHNDWCGEFAVDISLLDEAEA